MGITVVTPSVSQPATAGKSPPAITDPPAEGGSTTDSGNFAALLFGQLFGQGLVSKLPAITPPAQAEEALLTEEAGSSDGSEFLATLGLITPQIVALTTAGGESATNQDGPIATGVGTPGSTADGDATAKDLLTIAAGESDSGAAKFAAANGDALRAELSFAAAGKESPATTNVGPVHGTSHSPPVATSNDGTQNVATPVRDRAWGADFAQKVVWLASNDKQSAQLTLNPPQMGPIEISLNLSKDGATAVFVSPNAEVRDAIETALPKLREMLAGVGIELGQANVSSESFRQQTAPDEGSGGTTRWRDDTAILAADTRGSARSTGSQSGLGLVDTFA
ncbi:flagellar hook-length control protein FliK [Rhodocyclus tenuis]|uniref:flagellar hook-length control protein FliK n=1 Tax=Rhodocyclus tenuis TaxID=1066 RepID=UPI001904A3BA|nr:flagellar hook-length control protein FliK [Rhodocyclus tenuis]MBK1679978.1 hypothetical protein [Rhodocyclus tenuis]